MQLRVQFSSGFPLTESRPNRACLNIHLQFCSESHRTNASLAKCLAGESAALRDPHRKLPNPPHRRPQIPPQALDKCFRCGNDASAFFPYELMAQAGAEYSRAYRAEPQWSEGNCRIEFLMNRASISFGLPSLNPADPRAGKVSLYDVMPESFSIMFVDLLAREIEELGKLLPD